MVQIYSNAGIELSEDIKQNLFFKSHNEGMNVKTGDWGNMYEMGIIDPLKVTRTALENAVSVAVTILSTNAIITMARTYEDR